MLSLLKANSTQSEFHLDAHKAAISSACLFPGPGHKSSAGRYVERYVERYVGFLPTTRQCPCVGSSSPYETKPWTLQATPDWTDGRRVIDMTSRRGYIVRPNSSFTHIIF